MIQYQPKPLKHRQQALTCSLRARERVRAIGRRQSCAQRTLEIVGDDVFVPVLGQHEIDAGALVVAGEQQVGILHDNRGTGRMSGKRMASTAAASRWFGRSIARLRKFEWTRVVQFLPRMVMVIN